MMITENYCSWGPRCFGVQKMNRACIGLMFLLLFAPLPAFSEAPISSFNLLGLDGDSHQLESLQGAVVIVNFWASWCAPCRAEFPAMNRAWKKLQQKQVKMLAVNVGESETAVSAFVKDYPIHFPVLLDRDGSVGQAWQVMGMPTTIVLDKQGDPLARMTGIRDWDDPNLLTQIEQWAAMEPAH